METEYKKIGFDNYLSFYIKKYEYPNENMFELKIIEENKIKGLLNALVLEDEANMEIAFKISSLQKLSNFIYTKIWSLEEFNTFINNFLIAIKSIEEYILDINKIYLNLEYIFIDITDFNVYFCYIPTLNGDIHIELSCLFFALLDKLKTKDDKVFNLLHTYYKLSKNENFCLGDIEKNIFKEIKNENDDKNTNFSYKKEGKNYEKIGSEEINCENVQELNFINKNSEIIRENNKSEGTDIFNFKGIFGRKKKNKELCIEKSKEKDWEDIFSDTFKEKDDLLQDNKEDTKIDYEHTILLSNVEKDIKHVLRSQINGKEDIEIPYFPFVIGRQKRLCDYCLDEQGISRMHFKIEKVDDDFVICDLNSKNGIIVEGRRLENEEYCVIRRGYKIEIAKLAYIFE